MTFVETRVPSVFSSHYAIVPPPRTPVGPGMMLTTSSPPMSSSSSAMGKPRNSLDNWHKAEDRAGVTYYWNTQPMPPPPPPPQFSSHEKQRRPNGAGVRLAPPFPLSAPRPSTAGGEMMNGVKSPPPLDIYQNVPAMPRVRLHHSRSVPGASHNSALPRTPVADASMTTSMGHHYLSHSPTSADGHDDWRMMGNGNGVGGASTTRVIVNGNSSMTSPAKGFDATARVVPIQLGGSPEKKRAGRRKPRWTRCMQTFLCCVSPHREMEKTTNGRTPTSSTASLSGAASPITQVNKDGTVTGLPNGNYMGNGTSVQVTDSSSTALPPPALARGEKSLLPPLRPADSHKKCLIIDLDETLVHSSFKPVKNPDFVIPVEIDGVEHHCYVLKRPYVEEFLAKVGEKYECVLFTASLAKYADPVVDLLDKRGVFRARLFRDACAYNKGNYVKDLSRLGRDLNKVLIIDNSPASYAFHRENAIPVTTWFDDPTDSELLEILPMLDHIDKLESVYDAIRHDDMPMSDPLLNHSSC